jgi:putative transposase
VSTSPDGGGGPAVQDVCNGQGQNPLEDIWLQGKNFLRRHFYENKTFQQVKSSFLNFLNKKIFNFEKLKWYLEIPQPV